MKNLRLYRSLKTGMAVALCAASLTLAQTGMAQAAQKVRVNIPAQDLSAALTQFGRETGTEIVFAPDAVREKKAGAVKGEYERGQALKMLLEGSGLTYRVTAQGAILITPARVDVTATPTADAALVQKMNLAQVDPDSSVTSPAQPSESSSPAAEAAQESQEEEIVVTGTNIRGIAPDSSPLTVYTRQDIERTGAASVEQFLRTVPQNFSSNDRSTAQRISTNSSGVSNTFRGTTVDIHGVGNQATLVLLNGHRLAPAGDGQFSDVSLLPLSAIERIEILTDGASAIYGTDAISGVVNFVLKDDFEGAETALRYGAATRGGDEETTVSQLLGSRWSSGNIIFTGEYQREHGLLTTQRDFIPPQGFPVLILPEQERYNNMLNGAQQLFWGIESSGTAFFNRRESHTNGDQNPTQAVVATDTTVAIKQYGFNLDFHRDLGADWRASLQPGYARTIQGAINQTPTENFQSDFNITFKIKSLSAKVDGPLFALPAGDLKLAAGAEHRSEALREVLSYSGVFAESPTSHLDRDIDSAYGEIFAPLIGKDNQRFGVKRLELTGAIRYDRYEGIGSSANPKFGALWSPTEGMNLRATYGTSFRAPALQTRAQTPFYYVLSLNDPTSVVGSTDTLFMGYVTNRTVQPEQSESFTVGMDLRPTAIDGLVLSASYFHTKYKDRITFTPIPNGGDFTQIFPNETLLSAFIDRNPSLQQVQDIFNDVGFLGDYSNTGSGPAGVGALFYYGETNIASSLNSGLDFSASYGFPMAQGQATLSMNSTYLVENSFTPLAGGQTLHIRNDLGEPVDFKISSNFGWAKDGFSGNLAIRHVDGYRNSVTTPQTSVSEWTTADLQFGYDFGSGRGIRVLENVGLSLAIRNATDERPPFVLPPTGFGYLFQSVNYDSANADALGRVISLQVKKTWGQR